MSYGKKEFIKGKIAPIDQHSTVYFQTKTYTNIEETNEYDVISHMKEEIRENIDKFHYCGSGWYFEEVKRLEIHIVEYKPMRGGSYIPLPELIITQKKFMEKD